MGLPHVNDVSTLHRGVEEDSDGGDGAAAGGAEAVLQGEGEGGRRVPRRLRRKEPIEGGTDGGSDELGEAIRGDAEEREDPKRSTCHLCRVHGGGQVGRSGAAPSPLAFFDIYSSKCLVCVCYDD